MALRLLKLPWTVVPAYLFLVLSAVGCPQPESALCRGCNVILISVDTLRADHLGAYAYQRPVSPNIDALAARSLVFDDAISQSAWTRPAHASMMTGLQPTEHGIISMEGEPALPKDSVTLASILSAAGYQTWGLVGGGNVDARFGFDLGFDLYESQGRRFENHLERVADLLKAKSEDAQAKPFFLFFHGFDAHKPYKAPLEDRAALSLTSERSTGMDKLCRGPVRPEQLTGFVDDYDAAIHRGDRSLGTLFRLLEESGEADRTVILLTSDHGEEFGEHGGCFHIRTLHREVVSVPWILHVPGSGLQGRVQGPIAASTAVFGTILDVLGQGRVGDHQDSQAKARPGQAAAPASVFSATDSRIRGSQGGEMHALTTPRRKILHWVEHGRRYQFDRLADPDEKQPNEVAAGSGLALELDQWLGAHPRRQQPRLLKQLPGDLARQLRRLGYVD